MHKSDFLIKQLGETRDTKYFFIWNTVWFSNVILSIERSWLLIPDVSGFFVLRFVTEEALNTFLDVECVEGSLKSL